jgi:hypothetical protein
LAFISYSPIFAAKFLKQQRNEERNNYSHVAHVRIKRKCTGDVEYVTVIPTGTTTSVLPSYLSGEYQLQIKQGNYCFSGYINL